MHEVEGGGSRDRIQLMWNLADSRLWLIDKHWWVPGEIQFFSLNFVKIDKNAAKLFKFTPETKP